jgi:hypothetical protein
LCAWVFGWVACGWLIDPASQSMLAAAAALVVAVVLPTERTHSFPPIHNPTQTQTTQKQSWTTSRFRWMAARPTSTLPRRPCSSRYVLIYIGVYIGVYMCGWEEGRRKERRSGAAVGHMCKGKQSDNITLTPHNNQ